MYICCSYDIINWVMKRIGFVVSIVEFVEELLECDVFFVVVYFDSVEGVDVEEFIVVVK